ncbi:MAG TPA: pyridoxamine 5'-phosphate oxidase family protein [Geminicoccaceae bacterium]|nr:pyridoxamine 5'-phosphate oxidase family protein [Geminicoccus sp.]HMU51036.1 pyridoxamine 5'-phosphate oxidase family protein [Geminicoccaceae bacterium]
MDATALRERWGQPRELAEKKVLRRLDAHCRRFIALSPFLALGTSDAEGRHDVSPRGDRPGFVRVLDDTTLLIPDRPGNRRFDSLDNIARQPRLALLFLLPGVDETLRINGRGRTVDEPELLAPSAVDGKPPLSALLVEIEECFLHCGKALIRSRLWDPDTRIERRSFPSLARMIADQVAGVDERTADEAIEHAYREKLY